VRSEPSLLVSLEWTKFPEDQHKSSKLETLQDPKRHSPNFSCIFGSLAYTNSAGGCITVQTLYVALSLISALLLILGVVSTDLVYLFGSF
jgi:hypothetical protein